MLLFTGTIISERQEDNMIRHILLIRFTAEATTAQIASVREAFLSVPVRIQGVASVEWGRTTVRKERMPVTHIVS